MVQTEGHGRTQAWALGRARTCSNICLLTTGGTNVVWLASLGINWLFLSALLRSEVSVSNFSHRPYSVPDVIGLTVHMADFSSFLRFAPATTHRKTIRAFVQSLSYEFSVPSHYPVLPTYKVPEQRHSSIHSESTVCIPKQKRKERSAHFIGGPRCWFNVQCPLSSPSSLAFCCQARLNKP